MPNFEFYIHRADIRLHRAPHPKIKQWGVGDIDQSQLNRDYVQHINRHIKRVLGYPLQNV